MLTDVDGGFDEIHGLAIQKNAQVLVAGPSNAAGKLDFALARYDANH